MTAPEEPKPLLKVIDQNATPEDVAAIVAVLAALGPGEPPKKKPRSLWATPQLRTPLHPGPNAWRASALPN